LIGRQYYRNLLNRPRREEWANTATHGVAAVVAVAAAIALVMRARAVGDGWLVAGCVVYGISLSGTFACSALSHWPGSVRVRVVFRRYDQAFIYLLIAGSSTPFSLAVVASSVWPVVLGLCWAWSLLGFFVKAVRGFRVDRVSVADYLGLGWYAPLCGWALGATIPPGSIWGIVAGGFFYTAGTWFLLNDRRRWYYHAVWHLCVILGAAAHFVTTWMCLDVSR
jgi:hemolysin III